jgi:hypothetical protein
MQNGINNGLRNMVIKLLSNLLPIIGSIFAIKYSLIKRRSILEKKFVSLLLTMIFFVCYILIFDYFFKYIGMMFVHYGLILFIFQIGFSIVILLPASILTTNKIVEMIRG